MEPVVRSPDDDLASISGWHAHIYYDPATSRGRAERLRGELAERYPGIYIGSWHDVPVGPHTQAMFLIDFPPALFAEIVPFLAFSRDGLSVLVHADGTEDGRKAHTEQGIWLGAPVPLQFKPRGTSPL